MMRILIAVSSILLGLTAQAAERPNIVLILADDLGYSDLGCYGGEIETPHLDALAKDGMRFERFYNAGRCCPTRASLLTGHYPHRAGIGHMTYDAGEPGYRGNLNKETKTLAEVLKTADYQTGMVGKWHVTPHTKPDADSSNWPRQRGFDYFYGTLPGHGSLWDPAGLYQDNTPVEMSDGFFYTDAIADAAIKFVNNATTKEDPFFLYAAFTAPHYPLHARPKTIEKYDGVYDRGWDAIRKQRFTRLKKLGLLPNHSKLPPRDEGSIPWEDETEKRWQAHRMQVYAAMVDEMDQAIGRILGALPENSLVVFLSDNGGSPEGHRDNTVERLEIPWKSSLIPKTAPEGRPMRPGDMPNVDLGPADTYGSYGLRWASVSNTPFRRHKAWMHEGGIAAPCIIRWPGKVKAVGQISRSAGHIIDLMPTFQDVAGAKEDSSLPGKSLRAVLEGKAIDRDFLAWEHEGNRAIRKERWKLVSEYPGTWKYFYSYPKKGAWELYDLQADPTELNDLAPSHPDKVKELIKLYEQWAKESLVLPWNQLVNKQI